MDYLMIIVGIVRINIIVIIVEKRGDIMPKKTSGPSEMQRRAKQKFTSNGKKFLYMALWGEEPPKKKKK